jgi:hypothetical protein
MSLLKDLLERPFDQTITSKYTAMNGLIYLGAGTLVLIWPGMVQTIFRDAAFVGNEAPLAIAGVFPHFLLAFAVLDPTLGIGAWLLLSRSDRPRFHSTAGTSSP